MDRKPQTHGRTAPARGTDRDAKSRVSSVKGDPVKKVRSEHQAIIKALNSKPVSFVVRSAEGIPMYRGIESHSNNGNMPEIAKAGHAAALKRFQKIRAKESRKEKLAKRAAERDGQPDSAAP